MYENLDELTYNNVVTELTYPTFFYIFKDYYKDSENWNLFPEEIILFPKEINFDKI